MQLLDSKGNNNMSGYEDMPEAQSMPSQNQGSSKQQAMPTATHEAFDQLDDDIPF